MKIILLVSFLFLCNYTLAQPNCIMYPQGSGERKACELSLGMEGYQQGSKEKQQLLDSIISIGSKYAWAYYQKSVPYFKRGFLYEGLQILNKAIELEPIKYLCYRAYWYWQYQNYELCIRDLETYYAMPKSYMQFTPGGEKDMKIILALSYAKLGNYEEGILILTKLLKGYKDETDIGLSDYHTLGMLLVMDKQYEKSITALKKQLAIYENIADTYYYLGLAYKGIADKNEAITQFKNALLSFNSGNSYRNINAGFEVYVSDVEQEIKKIQENSEN